MYRRGGLDRFKKLNPWLEPFSVSLNSAPKAVQQHSQSQNMVAQPQQEEMVNPSRPLSLAPGNLLIGLLYLVPVSTIFKLSRASS
ncbi:hypothetical protein HRI_000893400 [Hibiscus trionum]|uniref:Uncharacterized protein n=1 Tax=Hibiscus trionum TaxID=183268 RepID=A0A9W7H7G6_HIBTR|nr:hypothetical protein HRI_000893400 [Hibiscus trionum]